MLKTKKNSSKHAEVAELADAHDSKSCSLVECGFDSHLRHQTKWKHWVFNNEPSVFVFLGSKGRANQLYEAGVDLVGTIEVYKLVFENVFLEEDKEKIEDFDMALGLFVRENQKSQNQSAVKKTLNKRCFLNIPA